MTAPPLDAVDAAEVEALADLLGRHEAWAGGQHCTCQTGDEDSVHEPLPVYFDQHLADAVLDSDWLAAHDAQVRAAEREAVVGAVEDALGQVHPQIGAYRKAQSAIGDLDREHIDVLQVGTILSALRREVINAYAAALRAVVDTGMPRCRRDLPHAVCLSGMPSRPLVAGRGHRGERMMAELTADQESNQELAHILAMRLRSGPGEPSTADRYYGLECAKTVLASDWLVRRERAAAEKALRDAADGLIDLPAVSDHLAAFAAIGQITRHLYALAERPR